ncbi:uncharacterized protein PODANS_2_12180 [Podospora anserina S mat+]|uniref:Podospora anserina S mat+ genomic DNA chromosome 2, supercontig 2 n=1 Tax=Podospora anserina (strain S / ATCC MYA-4624 / DSM 980 / FGSC 10383) TaxID=515849 RepID=B2B7T4_PODAN|nr:uncharacterized protein PODANS_2_12180 [Podospora anserina S mat+]CAP73863.1 unnamed protein product [Podospora anserina S mat+]CDP26262.1 Putative protein of unknown function [Podospora anserina S mat+]
MRCPLLLVPALSASTWAAPAFPKFTAALAPNIQAISDYFNILATKVQENRAAGSAPICDLSKLSLPIEAEPLGQPTPGLYLKHVAIGRGTQNYTCDLSNSTAVPQAFGALATLYNASCVTSAFPDVSAMLTRASLHFDVADNDALQRLAPADLPVSGIHYFTDGTTPFFGLDTPQWHLGEGTFGKNASTAAPLTAAKGKKGEAAVPWLRLAAKGTNTGGLQEVYRLETVGGSAPATCKGMPASFEIQYSTQYWFYASS